MIILARTNNNSNKFLYLFDEPGTYLHPQAQLDLQRTFEIISGKAQIVYTTHSLFLISKNYPRRNKVVSKTKEGTKIDQKPFQKNWKSVRESLGILLSNNFLIAEKTLLTEGPSDVIYILDAIKRLKGERRIDIDLNDMSIVDGGSSNNYLAMAKLMLSEGREVVALLDGDEGGDTTESKLKKTCPHEFGVEKLKITKLPQGNSIEDLFADVPSLQEAVKNVALFMIDNKLRVLKDNIDIDTEVKNIVPTKGITLGKILDKATASLFKEAETLSKLSIALVYEDIVAQREIKISNNAQILLEKLKIDLAIRGEKTVDAGVFEEVN
jgi:predicted ATP-dependent endonuclease of OLD family